MFLTFMKTLAFFYNLNQIYALRQLYLYHVYNMDCELWCIKFAGVCLL